MGDAVIAYARINNMVLEIIWELRQSSFNEKQKLAGRSTARIFTS